MKIIQNPKCPKCGEGKLIEHDIAIAVDTGCEIALEGTIKKIGIGNYEEFDSSWEAVYDYKNNSVGIVVDYSKDPNKDINCDLIDITYRCSACGKEYKRPRHLITYIKNESD